MGSWFQGDSLSESVMRPRTGSGSIAWEGLPSGQVRVKGEGAVLVWVSSVFRGEADPHTDAPAALRRDVRVQRGRCGGDPTRQHRVAMLSPWEASPPAVEPSDGVRPLVPASRSRGCSHPQAEMLEATPNAGCSSSQRADPRGLAETPPAHAPLESLLKTQEANGTASRKTGVLPRQAETGNELATTNSSGADKNQV